MADDKKGTVSIKMALEGVAKIERSIADIKAEFAGLGDEVRQIQTQFTSFSKGMNTVMSSAKSGFILGGFDKMKSNFKTNMSSFSRFATTALRGTLVGIGVTTASYIGDGIKKGLMLYPKLLTSQLSGIYNSVKNITGFDQFFSASGVLQGSIDLSQYAKQINAEAEQTGIATESVMQYKLAMDMAGVSSDNFGKRISYLGKQLTKAYAGTAPDAMRVLKELRLEERELMNLPIEERFIRVAEAIDGLADPSKRAHAAMLLFERGGNLMLPLFRNMRGRIEQTKKVLGDLPQILKANSDEFTQFANNVSLFSVKRQQFFAGFMQAGFADSGNTLMNNILETDFSVFGKKFAAQFKNTLDAIKRGSLSDFINSFSEELSNAVKIGIEKFSDIVQKVNWGEIGLTIGESIGRTIITILKEGGKTAKEVVSSAIDSSSDYLTGNGKYNIEELKDLLDEFNGDLDKARAKYYNLHKYQPYLNGSFLEPWRLAQEYQRPEKVQLDPVYESINVLGDSSLLKTLKDLNDRASKDWQKTLSELEKKTTILQDRLFKVSLSKEEVVGNWNTDDIEKYNAKVQELNAQLELKNQEFYTKILDNPGIEALYKKERLGQGEEFSKLLDDIANALEDPINGFEKLKSVIPTDRMEEFRKLLLDTAKIKAEINGMFDPRTYQDIDKELLGLSNQLEDNANQLRLIQQSGILSHEEQLEQTYATEREQLILLEKEYESLIQLREIAEGIGDKTTVENTTRRIGNVGTQIDILRSRENPEREVTKSRFDRQQALEYSRISNQISRIENNDSLFQFQKNQQIRDLYKEQIELKKQAIAQYEQLQESLDLTSEKERQIFDDLATQIDNMRSDIVEIQNMEPPTMFKQMRDDLKELADEWSSFETVSGNVMGIVENTQRDMSDALYDVWAQTKTGSEALESMWMGFRRAAARAITDTISQFIMSKSIMIIVEQGFNSTMAALGLARTTTTVTQETTAAAAVTAAWTPAAILKSIASMGVAVAVGMAAMMGIMAMFGGFASGGRVSGGRRLSWLNEEGSEYVVSAKSPASNDKWLELANEGVDLDKVALGSDAVSRVGGSSRNSDRGIQQDAPVIKQVTVRSQSEIREEWKRGGLLEFVRDGNLRRGWAV